MRKPWTIAIDGPAGAGKSTVARRLAARLGYLYIDSGAMYRTVALLSRRNNVGEDEPDQIAALARSAPIVFAPAASDADSDDQRVFLGDEEVTSEIRTPEIASLASVVSAIPGVRAALVQQQQMLGAQGGVVMEGRDIGTVVFPHAEVKVFLTASPQERAARRHRDILARGQAAPSLESVRADQDERDRRDATRAVSPLIAAEDAVLMDSDGLTPEQVAEQIFQIVDAQRPDGG